MHYRLLLLALFATTLLFGQSDAYHRDLVNYLNTAFTLPDPAYPLGDAEADILANSYLYGANSSQRLPEGGEQPFSTIVRVDAPAGGNPWEVGFGVPTSEAIQDGDRMLAIFYARSPSEGGGEVVLFAERTSDFSKDVYLDLEVGPEWKRYLIPFEIATGSQAAGNYQAGLHLARQSQIIEIGGFTLFNFGTSVPLEQLPRETNSPDYEGFEPDAPWRAAAAERIETLRKGDFTIKLRDGDTPLGNVTVNAVMQEHTFKWGTAIKACRWPGGRCANPTYLRNIYDLDGEGHTFNAFVFENDLKWDGWEQEWENENEHTLQIVERLAGEGFHLRGHVLLWPGYQNLPDDLQANIDDTDYLLRRVDDHLVDFLQTKDLDRYIDDWDVLNEIVTNTGLARTLEGTPGFPTGNELYANVFRRVRELAPDAELYLNDYITLTLKNGPESQQYQTLQTRIEELLAADAPITGVGFQSHIGASPNSIYDVLATFDDFYDRYGLDAKVTEFDIAPNVNEELAARYMADYMTAAFSHPSMTGFMFWNFWDVDTWANPSANLYREDWSTTPAHAAYTDLLFNQWWTEETLSSDADGEVSFRAFNGAYNLSFDCGGSTVTQRASLNGNTTVTVDCQGTVVSNAPEFAAGAIAVSPNPTTGAWQITNTLTRELEGRLLDLTGRTIWTGPLTAGTTPLFPRVEAGSYVLLVTDGTRVHRTRLVKQ